MLIKVFIRLGGESTVERLIGAAEDVLCATLGGVVFASEHLINDLRLSIKSGGVDYCA